MALDVQNPRASSALSAEFDLQGRVRPKLEEFIVPTAIVADLCQGGPPVPARRCTANISIAAVAGQFSLFSLNAPPGVVALVTRFSVRSTVDVAMQATFDSTTTAPGAGAQRAFTDIRTLIGTGNTPFCGVTQGTAVAGIATVEWEEISFAAGPILQYKNPGWIVFNPPGGAGQRSIVWGAHAVNLALFGTVEWLEWSLSR